MWCWRRNSFSSIHLLFASNSLSSASAKIPSVRSNRERGGRSFGVDGGGGLTGGGIDGSGGVDGGVGGSLARLRSRARISSSSFSVIGCISLVLDWRTPVGAHGTFGGIDLGSTVAGGLGVLGRCGIAAGAGILSDGTARGAARRGALASGRGVSA